jgi:protein XRP2
MEETKPDPRDFMLSSLSEQEIVRQPGQINGYDFVIESLQRCNVYLLDYSAQITIDDCTECNFYIGPCTGSIFIRDCSNCTVSASSAQFRTKNCHNIDLSLFCASDPSIEYSDGLRFAPLNLSYP